MLSKPTTNAPLSGIGQYATYVLVGVGVTVATVLLRSLIGLVIPDDSAAGYQTTIVLAYLVGMVFSLVAHKSITFRRAERLNWKQVATFFGVHGIGMVLNLLGSSALRGVLAQSIPDEWAKAIAFGVVAFAVSLLAFALKKLLVFVEPEAA